MLGDEDNPHFPGCKADRGFRCDLKADLVEPVTRQEFTEITGIKRSKERFNAMLNLLLAKTEIITQKDHPLDYIVIVLPNKLYEKCRATDFIEKGIGAVHRDLRRAYKAAAMKYHVPTQFLQETTTRLAKSNRDLDHASRIAWNLFTGMYFKVDGLPWSPMGLPPSSCFIGISFFRPLGQRSTLRTSVVQAFDENGEGLILRGHNFRWDEGRGEPTS